VGWKLCVPGAAEAQALLGSQAAPAAAAPLEPAALNVFAAASLTEAFNEMGQNFTAAHPGVTFSGESGDQVGRLDIPDALNTVATYPIAVVGDSAAPAQAQAFVAYVLSPAGQDILTRYGFIPAAAK
jgi:ABC-type molybdate transport system substrate-binding protein